MNLKVAIQPLVERVYDTGANYKHVADFYFEEGVLLIEELPASIDGTPAIFAYGKGMRVRLPATFLDEDLRELAETLEPKMDALKALYDGESWNGSNHVARWKDLPRSQALRQEISDAIEEWKNEVNQTDWEGRLSAEESEELYDRWDRA